MNRIFIEELMDRLEFSFQERVATERILSDVQEKAEVDLWKEICAAVLMPDPAMYETNLKKFDLLCEQTGLRTEELCMALFLAVAERTRGEYARRGYAEEIFWEGAAEVKVWGENCKEFKGYWGASHFPWQSTFLRSERVTLGRMSFLPCPYKGEQPVEISGVVVHPGDTVISVHISASGPLYHEEVLASYDRAWEFYTGKKGPLVLSAESWILHPAMDEILDPQSRLLAFSRDFQRLHYVDQEVYKDAWRMFGAVVEEKPMEEWPRENSLQRGILDWLLSGKKLGTGYGLMVLK